MSVMSLQWQELGLTQEHRLSLTSAILSVPVGYKIYSTFLSLNYPFSAHHLLDLLKSLGETQDVSCRSPTRGPALLFLRRKFSKKVLKRLIKNRKNSIRDNAGSFCKRLWHKREGEACLRTQKLEWEQIPN